MHSIRSDILGLPHFGSLLQAVDETSQMLHVPFFLTGALARDVLLCGIAGVEASSRATLDADVVISVADWSEFDRFRARLIEQHGFSDDGPAHTVTSSDGLRLDLMPFGEIEDRPGIVAWPPDGSREMTVLGFAEAARSTETVSIDGVVIDVISLRALGPIKLLSWSDRRLVTRKDAEDLCYILRSFYEAEGATTILDFHADLFEEEDGDTDLIGARAYGRECAAFVSRSPALMDRVQEILDKETSDQSASSLAEAMAKGSTFVSYENRFDLLFRFRKGLTEVLEGRVTASHSSELS